MRLAQERRRDNHQWILDWVIKETGMVQNFERERMSVPSSVKSYAMIPKIMGKVASHHEEIALKAEEAGHYQTARELYLSAVQHYHTAQHSIFQDGNKLKIQFHQALLRCYDKAMHYAGHPVELVEVPWEGVNIQCSLHLLPDRQKAPCVVYVPGMDQTKEVVPAGVFVQRGMHVIVMDGPGQGTSNIRKIRVTDDNYERAGAAVVDYLITLPEVDPQRIAVFGLSMGSFWGTRIAAHDQRVRAAAVRSVCVGDKTAIFEQSSPRFKQVFMYMAGIRDEDEFDQMAAKMTTVGYGRGITCPFLITTGEYDPLRPLEESERLYEELAGPKELWVVENSFHGAQIQDGLEGIDCLPFMADWLKDALAGKYGLGHSRYVYIQDGRGAGPYAEGVKEFASMTA